jgi:hypothetical protein
MSLYQATLVQQKKMLLGLEKWIDTAEAYAKKKSFDTSVLVNARLAPDQYPFVRQVQAACDAAKFGAARLTGKTPPSHPDTETTFDELRARIRSVTSYLDTFSPADFEGAADRKVALPFLEGKVIRGEDYANQMVLANFYFHVTTAYAILRHNGVELGKRDFLGAPDVSDA